MVSQIVVLVVTSWVRVVSTQPVAVGCYFCVSKECQTCKAATGLTQEITVTVVVSETVSV